MSDVTAEQLKEADPSGVIRESYAIEGVSLQDCRIIFFNWVIARRTERDTAEDVAMLLAVYGNDFPDHPMTEVLREGQGGELSAKGRRGGWRARRG